MGIFNLADMAEGYGWQMGDDEGLLGLVQSADIACGFHAGDANIMARVMASAHEKASVSVLIRDFRTCMDLAAAR